MLRTSHLCRLPPAHNHMQLLTHSKTAKHWCNPTHNPMFLHTASLIVRLSGDQRVKLLISQAAVLAPSRTVCLSSQWWTLTTLCGIKRLILSKWKESRGCQIPRSVLWPLRLGYDFFRATLEYYILGCDNYLINRHSWHGELFKPSWSCASCYLARLTLTSVRYRLIYNTDSYNFIYPRSRANCYM